MKLKVKETVSVELAKLDKRLRRKGMRSAGNAASQVVLNAMRPRAPTAKADYGPGGSTKRSLGKKVKVFKNGLVVWYAVGPRSSWSRMHVKKHKFYKDKAGKVHKFRNTRPFKVQPSRIAHLIERQHPFVRPTMMNTRRQQLDAMGTELAKSIQGK